MSSPPNWAVADLEKQDVSDSGAPPTDGGTTLADETAEVLESPIKANLSRQWTDRLKQSIRSPSFALPEKFKPAKYDENDRNISRIDFHPKGYPRLAAYINSDENFMMCRRFGFLHTRVLLYRQDEIRELEDQLIRLDDEDKDENPLWLQSRKLDDAREGGDRRALIKEIDEKLKEYDELVLRCKTLASLQRTSSRDYQSLANWMHNEKPLSQEESEFVDCKEDFIALCEPQEGGWFDGLIEDTLSKIECKFTRLLFTSADQRRKSADPYIKYYSKYRIDLLVRIVICLLAVALLVVPVVLLFCIPESNVLKIVVLLGFTMFFCVCISVFTKAKRHEVFAATAAYTAVLVVFLGNYIPGLQSTNG